MKKILKLKNKKLANPLIVILFTLIVKQTIWEAKDFMRKMVLKQIMVFTNTYKVKKGLLEVNYEK